MVRAVVSDAPHGVGFIFDWKTWKLAFGTGDVISFYANSIVIRPPRWAAAHDAREEPPRWGTLIGRATAQ
eukprot:scaffold57534_cov63-Phaeocystis_antarctica.AAC.1